MPIGRLERFDHERGFGFLRRENEFCDRDDFVHIRALRDAGIHDPAVGDILEYALELRNGKESAAAIARLWRAGGPS